MKLGFPRRTFLRTAALGGAGLMTTPGAWSLSAASKAGSAHLTIIDTHTHFYDPKRPEGVPWPPKEDALLYRTVLPEDYTALPTPSPVAGTVVVEASPWVADNEWILNLAANHPFIVGFVGNLPTGTSEFMRHLRHFSQNPVFRGLRIGGTRLKQGLSSKGFMSDLKELARRDLALDILGGPDVLPDVAQLARRIPSLRIIIDHVASVKIDGNEPPTAWLRGVESASRFSRVYCKVSGLVEGTGKADGNAPSDPGFYEPVLDAVWNTFGSERLIYGSNWPVSERFAPLATVQQIAMDYFSRKGNTAMNRVFSANASRAYKWVSR